MLKNFWNVFPSVQEYCAVFFSDFQKKLFIDNRQKWYSNVCWVSGPVNFNVLARFVVQLHGCAASFLVLRNVITEQGVH